VTTHTPNQALARLGGNAFGSPEWACSKARSFQRKCQFRFEQRLKPANCGNSLFQHGFVLLNAVDVITRPFLKQAAGSKPRSFPRRAGAAGATFRPSRAHWLRSSRQRTRCLCRLAVSKAAKVAVGVEPHGRKNRFTLRPPCTSFPVYGLATNRGTRHRGHRRLLAHPLPASSARPLRFQRWSVRLLRWLGPCAQRLHCLPRA